MLPLRHLSIRVPWHDSGWDGTVCQNPAGNMSCLVLKGIGPKRDDVQEMANRGKSLELLPEDQRPCCMNERGFFMAPFEVCRTKNHPYTETSPETHGHFRPTPFRQGDPADLRNYVATEHSETARRLTNLFTEPEPVMVKDRRYDGKHGRPKSSRPSPRTSMTGSQTSFEHWRGPAPGRPLSAGWRRATTVRT
jgi:hypothetical protein